MDKHYFEELLRKYLKGEATGEESRFLISYYNLFELEPEVEAILNEERKRVLKREIRESIKQRIETEERSVAKVRMIDRRFTIAVAASILIVLCCTIFLLTNRHLEAKPNLISLQNKQKENRLIHLPDGSTVIVNTGSNLRYPASFAGRRNRDVYLEGEAYFDISHQPDQPFVVHAGNLQTTVLGTAFNIKAIRGEPEITVTVTRGKVKISDSHKTVGLITKGQEMIYDNNRGKSTRQVTRQDVMLDWKSQDLFLDDVTVEDAAKLLEERFDLKILIQEAAIRTSRFSTVFNSNEGVEQVLKSICEFNNAAYEYHKEESSVIIRKK